MSVRPTTFQEERMSIATDKAHRMPHTLMVSDMGMRGIPVFPMDARPFFPPGVQFVHLVDAHVGYHDAERELMAQGFGHARSWHYQVLGIPEYFRDGEGHTVHRWMRLLKRGGKPGELVVWQGEGPAGVNTDYAVLKAFVDQVQEEQAETKRPPADPSGQRRMFNPGNSIGRLVVVGWPARTTTQAAEWLGRTLKALQTHVKFLVGPGGFLTRYVPLGHLQAGWGTPANILEYFRADAAQTVMEVWKKVPAALRGKASYFSFGLDYRDAAKGVDQHAELVAVMDLRTGALAHLTGKSFPTQDQENTLLRVKDWKSHFWGKTLLMGCHDLNVFSGRGAKARRTGSEREVVASDFFKTLEKAEKPNVLLHHPHSTEVVATWVGGWAGAKAHIPNVEGASGISYEPLPYRAPDALPVVLDRTRTTPTVDVGIEGNKEIEGKQADSIPPRLMESFSQDDFERRQKTYQEGVLDAEHFARTGTLRRPRGRTTFPQKPSPPRAGLQVTTEAPLRMGNPPEGFRAALELVPPERRFPPMIDGRGGEVSRTVKHALFKHKACGAVWRRSYVVDVVTRNGTSGRGIYARPAKVHEDNWWGFHLGYPGKLYAARGPFQEKCPTCGKGEVSGTPVHGKRTDEPCGAKCLAATGPNCECSCAGANHGAAHGGGRAQNPIPPLPLRKEVHAPRVLRSLTREQAAAEWARLWDEGKHKGAGDARGELPGWFRGDVPWVEVEIPMTWAFFDWQHHPVDGVRGVRIHGDRLRRASSYAKAGTVLPPGVALYRGGKFGIGRAIVHDGNHRGLASFLRNQTHYHTLMPLADFERLASDLGGAGRQGNPRPIPGASSKSGEYDGWVCAKHPKDHDVSCPTCAKCFKRFEAGGRLWQARQGRDARLLVKDLPSPLKGLHLESEEGQVFIITPSVRGDHAWKGVAYPWQITSFFKRDGEMVPSGHQNAKTVQEAVEKAVRDAGSGTRALKRIAFRNPPNPSPVRDHEQRAHSLRLFDRLVTQVQNNQEMSQSSIGAPGSYVIRLRGGLRDLYVVLTPGGGEEKGGALAFTPDKTAAIIILYGVLRAPGDLTYADTRLSSFKNVFVHEAQHYQDWKRTGYLSPGGSKKHLARGGASGTKAYHQSPEEWNAYYQEGWAGYEDFIRGVQAHPALAKHHGEKVYSWEHLIQNLSKWWPWTWLGDIMNDPKRTDLRKKFFRRLRGDFDHMQERQKMNPRRQNAPDDLERSMADWRGETLLDRTSLMRVLNALAHHELPLTLRQVAQESGLSETTARKALPVLVQKGWVRQLPNSTWLVGHSGKEALEVAPQLAGEAQAESTDYDLMWKRKARSEGEYIGHPMTKGPAGQKARTIVLPHPAGREGKPCKLCSIPHALRDHRGHAKRFKDAPRYLESMVGFRFNPGDLCPAHERQMNPGDEDLRLLERQAQEGDIDALDRLTNEAARRGDRALGERCHRIVTKMIDAIRWHRSASPRPDGMRLHRIASRASYVEEGKEIPEHFRQNPAPAPRGNCYYDAFQFQKTQGTPSTSLLLVHGSVPYSKAQGGRIPHAWVEISPRLVWEPQTRQYFKSPVPPGGLAIVKYTRAQAQEAIRATKNYGPWDPRVEALAQASGVYTKHEMDRRPKTG